MDLSGVRVKNEIIMIEEATQNAKFKTITTLSVADVNHFYSAMARFPNNEEENAIRVLGITAVVSTLLYSKPFDPQRMNDLLNSIQDNTLQGSFWKLEKAFQRLISDLKNNKAFQFMGWIIMLIQSIVVISYLLTR